MITKFSVAVVFAVLFGSPSFAQDAGSQKFLKEAIEGNLAEVEMGKLSQKQGASEGVRAFGQMLEKDHSDANKKATAVANSIGMTAPTAPNKKQKADYDKMSKLSGAKFDKEFAAHMVADHKKDIKEYEKAAKKQDAVGNYAKDVTNATQALGDRAILEWNYQHCKPAPEIPGRDCGPSTRSRRSRPCT